jgi:hypothetical protein
MTVLPMNSSWRIEPRIGRRPVELKNIGGLAGYVSPKEFERAYCDRQTAPIGRAALT